MKFLIRQARVISANSPLNGHIKDILITDGIISKIADQLNETSDQEITAPGLCVSVGWLDPFADFADPGFESRESIVSGAAAAAAGGFTDVMLIPNSNPVIQNKTLVEYIIQNAKLTPVNIHAIGAITKNTEGKELSEMYDMRLSGAVAFSDGINPVQQSGLLLKALQYVKAFDGIIIQVPDDKSIGQNSMMNEGIVSTRLGLPGKPIIAEELMVARDIKLTGYTASKMHFTGISSRQSLEYIKNAKDSGLPISCSVAPYQLFFCDEDLEGYDTNLKLIPPLRTRQEMLSLRQALEEGIIDCIASHHLPQDWDGKTCEFENAKPGMISLETVFAVLTTVGCPVERFVEMQTTAVRNIFGLPVPVLAEGEKAVLSLFNPEGETIVDEKDIRSKSRNTPFTGLTLKGKVIGIINGTNLVLN